MKRLIAATSLACLGLLSSHSVLAQSAAKQTTYAIVVCESLNNVQSFCKADAYLGARLAREISHNRCHEGRTYGFERGGIWINGGCRGEFEIGRGVGGPGSGPGPGPGPGPAPSPGPGYHGELLLCESINDRRAYCAADARAGVQLVRQLSRDNCYEGQTWGYDQRGVWVDHGCRAEFRIAGPGHGGYPPGSGGDGYPISVICRSVGGNQQICPLDVGRHRVELVRRISKAACVQGQSWGYDRRNVWVSNGCRGEFAVVRAREPQFMTCESLQDRRQYCPANTVYGVELSRQLSRSPCSEGYTWGYDRNAIWVDQGCRAEFIVH